MKDDETELVRAIGVLRRRWLLVLGIPVLAVSAAVSFSLSQPKQYEATAVLLTGQGNGIADLGQILAVSQATQSLNGMITERVVIEEAARKTGIRTDTDVLLRRVSSEVPPNTQQIRLTVVDEDPRVAARFANSIAETFSELVDERAAPKSNLSASVWSPAVPPDEPSSPRPVLAGLAAFVAGLLLGIGAAFVREHFDGRWRSEHDIESYLGLPVLSTIPTFRHEHATSAIRKRKVLQ